MKTAISINDGLLQEADETARLMGLSRSRLFAMAVGDFLQRQRREQMLLRLNEVYAKGRGDTRRLHWPTNAEIAMRSLRRSRKRLTIADRTSVEVYKTRGAAAICNHARLFHACSASH